MIRSHPKGRSYRQSVAGETNWMEIIECVRVHVERVFVLEYRSTLKGHGVVGLVSGIWSGDWYMDM